MCSSDLAEFVYGTVEDVEVKEDGTKLVKTDSGDLSAPVVIIATGSVSRKLGVPGEEEYSGRGVSYCAVCDGAFYKGREVVVIGGGDSAVEEGMYLANLTSKVKVVHRRDQLRAQKILQERAFKNDKIDFTWDTVVEEILGDGQKVTGVKVLNKKTGETSVIDASGALFQTSP